MVASLSMLLFNGFNAPGQGWLQLGELTMAFFLRALVGLERELRQKSAGFRTHTLVGVSAATPKHKQAHRPNSHVVRFLQHHW